MKAKKFLAVFLTAAAVFSLAACGASKQEASEPSYPGPDYGIAADMQTTGFSAKPGNLPEQKADSSASLAENRTSYLPSDVKLIYRANADLQTEKFEEAEQKLKDAVQAAGGYFESQSVLSGDYYSRGTLRRGEYVLRIPAEKYREFVDGMSQLAVVTGLKETVEDVGQSYHETEVRLKTLYAKEERLQELLRKAGDLNDIIQLENALSDTEYQIDMYGSTLNRYDSLISFATVSLSLQEVSRPEAGIGEKNGFFATLGRSFVSGLEKSLSALEDFAFWVSENLIPLALCAAAAILVWRKHPIRKLRAKIAVRREEKKKQ